MTYDKGDELNVFYRSCNSILSATTELIMNLSPQIYFAFLEHLLSINNPYFPFTLKLLFNQYPITFPLPSRSKRSGRPGRSSIRSKRKRSLVEVDLMRRGRAPMGSLAGRATISSLPFHGKMACSEPHSASAS